MSAKMGHKVSIALPRLGFSCLILCLLSGIVLTFYYRPMGNVFQNVEEITSLVPFGWFFRQFHYGAGQVFVILMLAHTLQYFLKRRYAQYLPREWTLLIVSLFICFLTLFTGFILKGDKEGFFAGQILANILDRVPVAGESLTNLFIDRGEEFFFLPYLYHCFFLPPLILYLVRSHVRDWLPDTTFLLVAFVGLCVYTLVARPCGGIPPDAPMEVVKGPWFFLGLQSLLRVMPPFWAGLFIPGLFVAGLLLLPFAGHGTRSGGGKGAFPPWCAAVFHYLIMGSLLIYGFLTVRAMVWSP